MKNVYSSLCLLYTWFSYLSMVYRTFIAIPYAEHCEVSITTWETYVASLAFVVCRVSATLFFFSCGSIVHTCSYTEKDSGIVLYSVRSSPVLKNMLTSSPLQIHWFSIFNSFMMVIFLVGLVSMILMRTLRKDYARYSREEDLDDLVRGWWGRGGGGLEHLFANKLLTVHWHQYIHV